MDRFGGIIFEIARKNAVSVDEVKNQIELTAKCGLESSDPNIRYFWNQVPKRGELPTAEEVICHLSYIAARINSAEKF